MYTADHLMSRSILDMGTAQLETELLFVNDRWVERCKVSYINGKLFHIDITVQSSAFKHAEQLTENVLLYCVFDLWIVEYG